MPDCNPFTTADQMTLQKVLDNIQADAGLPLQRRRNICSSIRTLGKLMGRDLGYLPAHPGFYREFLKQLHPEHCGLTNKRLGNIKSDVLFALRQTGCIHQGHTYMAPFTSEWQQLKDSAEFVGALWRYLARLMHFCSAHGIAPDGVDDRVSQLFLTAIVEESFVKDPVKTHQDICRLWNRAVQEVPGWPEVTLTTPRYKQTYSLPLESFPVPFRDEVDALFTRWAGTDILDDAGPLRPMKPRTLQSRRYRLRQIVSALVLQGWNMEDITSLARIVEIDAAKLALRYHLERAGDKITSQIHSLAVLIKTIAQHWVRVDEDHLNALKELCRKVDPGNKGISFPPGRVLITTSASRSPMTWDLTTKSPIRRCRCCEMKKLSKRSPIRDS